MNEIKVICCDIDGTLLRNDKSLSEENRYWISKAEKEKQVRFVIVSGRMLSALKVFNSSLGITGLSSCLNGTFLVDESDSVLASHTIPYEVSQKIVQTKKECNIDMLAIAQNVWYTESHDSFIFNRKKKMYMQDSVLADFEELIKTTAVNKFVFMSPDKSDLDVVHNALCTKLDRPDQVTFYEGKEFLEVMTGGITKGTAVDDLINYYKIDRSRVMALGDDINDIEMLQKAGLGIAMGNALDCVKSVADAITDTNENDGVAKAIQKYIFNL